MTSSTEIITLIGSLASAIGALGLFAGFIYFGRKLQVLDNLVDTVTKLKNNTQIMANALIKSENIDFDGDKLQTFSPMQIKSGGIEYLKKAGFIDLFEENRDDFMKYIKDENPKTEYDVENIARLSVFFQFDKPYFDQVKSFLYNNPREDEFEFAQVAGIYVRDEYLKEFPLIK